MNDRATNPVRAAVRPSRERWVLQTFFRDPAEERASVDADAYSGYERLEGDAHERANHSASQYVRGGAGAQATRRPGPC